jgi:hypothetical protein
MYIPNGDLTCMAWAAPTVTAAVNIVYIGRPILMNALSEDVAMQPGEY